MCIVKPQAHIQIKLEYINVNKVEYKNRSSSIAINNK